MELSRWKCLPLVFTLQLACADPTTPPSVRGVYLLESVGGSPLPAVIHAGNGYATTVIWSTLSFGPAETATLIERLRRTSPNDPPAESNHTTGYSYRITDEGIRFDYWPPCPPNALCVEPPVGRVNGSTLTLLYGDPAFRPSSLFRLTDAD